MNSSVVKMSVVNNEENGTGGMEWNGMSQANKKKSQFSNNISIYSVENEEKPESIIMQQWQWTEEGLPASA